MPSSNLVTGRDPGLHRDYVTSTDREAWEAASANYQAAREQVKRLREALAVADDALEFAQWYLTLHELRPGVPLYTQAGECCAGVECHCDNPAR